MRIKFEYKNHRGLIEERDVDIVAVNFDFTVHPEYGYQPGWCFAGWDYSRGREGKEYRTFYYHNVILQEHSNAGRYQPVFTLFELPRETPEGQIEPKTSIDPVVEFGMWLTTRKSTIKVGASETVYDMNEAIEEYKMLKGPSHGQAMKS